jgi:alcohol dehydrogenase class IV
MEPFVYNALPSRVVFGHGTLAQLADEVRALGCQRALVLSTAHQARKAYALAESLDDLAAGVFAGAVMHTPVAVTEQAMETVRRVNADCLVAIGGGSTIGLGKAIALRTDLPQIAIPTTYAGSEATPILGQTEHGVKTTRRGSEILPETIVYDVDLTLTMPRALSVTSGLNAIAHAVEGLYARDANPLISMLALDGIRALAGALPRIGAIPSPGADARSCADKEARSDALYGAWACGVTLGAVGMSLHHKLCHTLGGTFDLPHAQTHAVLLPHVMAYNAQAAEPAMARIAQVIGVNNAPMGLWEMARDLGAPTALSQLGMPREGIEHAVALVLANPYWNPAALEEGRLRQLFENAYEGRTPVVFA